MQFAAGRLGRVLAVWLVGFVEGLARDQAGKLLSSQRDFGLQVNYVHS